MARNRTYKDCLWRWHDLTGKTDEWLCYNGACKHYHNVCLRKCRDWEKRVILGPGKGRWRQSQQVDTK